MTLSIYWHNTSWFHRRACTATPTLTIYGRYLRIRGAVNKKKESQPHSTIRRDTYLCCYCSFSLWRLRQCPNGPSTTWNYTSINNLAWTMCHCAGSRHFLEPAVSQLSSSVQCTDILPTLAWYILLKVDRSVSTSIGSWVFRATLYAQQWSLLDPYE